MQFVQAKFYGKANRKPGDIHLITIHSMEMAQRSTTAESCAAFFSNPIGADGKPAVASAHYCVDDDSVVQCVREEDVAWHAGPVNDYSIGIEHAGYASQTAEQWGDPFSKAMIFRSAELVASLCRKYSIPIVRLSAQDLAAGNRRGICGHVDVTNGLQGGKGHWDPGPNFPWTEFMVAVAAAYENTCSPTDPPPPSGQARELIDLFVPISLADGSSWQVAPLAVAPVAIGEAEALARRMGCELPSPALVDAIWRAADMRVPPDLVIQKHDGTPAGMNSPEIYAAAMKAVANFIGAAALGTDYRICAGAFKDVVRDPATGKVGLYGWHVADAHADEFRARTGIGLYRCVTPGDGQVVQPLFTGHAVSWKDYSQSLRLCRRAG